MKSFPRIVNCACYAAVAAVAVYLTAHYSAYVYKFHALSMFEGSWDWFAAHFDRPAALLTWCGRLFTQICCRPALAIVLLMLLLAATVWLIRRYIVCDKRFGALSVFPATLMLLFVMRLGYNVYILKSDALIFTQPLGLLCALCLFRLLISSRGGIFKPLFVAVIGFPLSGFYSLLALLMFAFRTLARGGDNKRFAAAAVSLASAAAVPYLWYLVAFNGANPAYLWLYGLPYPDLSGLWGVAWPLVAALALPLLLCLIPFRNKEHSSRWLSAAVAVFSAAVAIPALYILPCRDSLLHRQLKAERCIEAGDWDGVLKQTSLSDVTNDILVAYRNIALFRKGQLVEKCCSYSFDCVPVYVNGNQMVSSRLAGPTIFFHSGLVNFASRWAFELNLGNAYALERIKYLAKCALVNGEYGLASKYIDAVGRNPFQHSWARRYRALLSNPESISDDPELAPILKINRYSQKFWLASDKAANNVPAFYLYMDTACDTPEFLEWAMATAMMTKTQNHFEDLYSAYATAFPDMPESVRQARLIFAVVSEDSQRIDTVRKDLGDSVKIDPDDRLNYAHYYYQKRYAEPF